MHEIEFYLAIDNNGEFVISTDDAETANEELRSGVNSEAVKVVKITLNVPLPKVVEVAGTLPDTDGPVTLTIA